MKIFKPIYTDKNGKKKKCNHYYLTFTDNKGSRCRLPAHSNKRASEKLSEKIEELLSSGGILSPDLQRWIENLSPKMRDKLVKLGLIDSQRVNNNIGKPLSEHVRDYLDGLRADKRKANHIGQAEMILNRIIDGCGFRYYNDIDGHKVKIFLAEGRSAEGYGERTYNCYLMTIKSFCNWMVENERENKNPLKRQKTIKQTVFRKVRRAMTQDEKERLLTATQQQPSRYNMSGYERYLAYVMALNSGLRYSEIKSLKVSSFNFYAKSVMVKSTNTKDKEIAEIPLSSLTAKLMQDFLSNKTPQVKAFNLPHKANASKMIKADLEQAGIEFNTDEGDVDFHSLRHTFCTNLVASGTPIHDAQQLMRHKDVQTTMKFYTHVKRESLVSAIDRLDNLTTGKRDKDKKVG